MLSKLSRYAIFYGSSFSSESASIGIIAAACALRISGDLISSSFIQTIQYISTDSSTEHAVVSDPAKPAVYQIAFRPEVAG